MRNKLVALALLASTTTIAQTQPQAQTSDLENLQQLDRVQKAMDALKQLQVLTDKMYAEKNMAGMKAVGAPAFCSCLTENLPIRWTFPEYVAITISSKEENGYDKLSAEDKKGYDLVGPARDKCVKQAFGGKK